MNTPHLKSQHLSNEAIAACADGVLARSARERALRHTAACPECAYAVAVQREAVWALRSAPAPALPSGLLDRLCAVPTTTPLTVVPTSIAPDGSAMFATFGSMSAAALVPSTERPARTSRLRPIASTAAAVAVAGVLVVGSAAHASGQQGPSGPTSVAPAGYPGGQVQVQPATLRENAGR